MSTRSYIGIDNGDNTATFIYCHYDGYPQGVGATLNEHYKDAKTVKKLINLGDISILGNKPDDKKSAEYWRLEGNGAFDDLDKYITDDDTISYNGRGEDPKRVKAFTVAIDKVPPYVAYVYLFRGSKWYFYDFVRWRRLDRALKDIKEGKRNY